MRAYIKRAMGSTLYYIGLDKEIVDLLGRFYNSYAYKKKGAIFLIFFGAILSGAIEVSGLILLYKLLKVLIDLNDSHAPAFLASTFAAFGITDKAIIIPLFSAFILSVFILKNAYLLFFYHVQHLSLRQWRYDLSNLLMERYLKSPYAFLLSYNSAAIVKNVNSTVVSAINGFVLAAFNYVTNIVTGILIVCFLFAKFFEISIVIGAVLVLSTLLQNKFLKTKQRQIGAENEKLITNQTKNVYQGIQALKETKVFGKEEYFLKQFQKGNIRSVENDSKILFYSRLPTHITETVIILAIILFCVITLNRNIDNSAATISSLGILAAVAFRIAPIMNRTIGAVQELNRNLSPMRLLFSEFDKLNAFTFHRGNDPGRDEKMKFERDLVFNNVVFEYRKAKRPVIDGISFSVKRGEFIGIVGPSGAGKTTLMDILLGLLDPTNGFIEVDGQRITEKNKRAWQNNLGYVPQSVFLSDTSIAENVAFGIEKSKIDYARVMDVITTVGLADFVLSKDRTLNFRVGENGKYLSGGQKQRIGIARALYLNSSVMVLDEATSALDVVTEASISSALKEMRQHQTIFVIAHRLSTVSEADRIFFMEKGKIIDTGNFADLCTRNEKFRELARLAKLAPYPAERLDNELLQT